MTAQVLLRHLLVQNAAYIEILDSPQGFKVRITPRSFLGTFFFGARIFNFCHVMRPGH
jgi:hypothetical protein